MTSSLRHSFPISELWLPDLECTNIAMGIEFCVNSCCDYGFQRYNAYRNRLVVRSRMTPYIIPPEGRKILMTYTRCELSAAFAKCYLVSRRTWWIDVHEQRALPSLYVYTGESHTCWTNVLGQCFSRPSEGLVRTKLFRSFFFHRVPMLVPNARQFLHFFLRIIFYEWKWLGANIGWINNCFSNCCGCFNNLGLSPAKFPGRPTIFW